jgi:hypothetical protein
LHGLTIAQRRTWEHGPDGGRVAEEGHVHALGHRGNRTLGKPRDVLDEGSRVHNEIQREMELVRMRVALVLSHDVDPSRPRSSR